MANYDPQSLESVLSYMRQEFGTDVFLDANRIYGTILDLSQELKPYGNVMRQLASSGALGELEAAVARKDEIRRDRALMKARHILENELLLGADRAGYVLGAVGALYGIDIPHAPPPQAVTPTLTQAAPGSVTQSAAPGGVTQSAPSAPIVKRGSCGDNVSFALDSNGVLTISGSGPMENFNPDYMELWNDKSNPIFHMEIQNGVTLIALRTMFHINPAFYDYPELKSVTIPRSVTEIGDYAFLGCSGLTGVAIPRSVKKIGKFAFLRCSALTNVAIPTSVREIGNSAFKRCESLTSVALASSVETIGDWAFSGCGVLTSVAIPDGVAKIGEGVFADCGALTSVIIPDSVEEIGENAFIDCVNLRSVSVPLRASVAPDAFPAWVSVTRTGSAASQSSQYAAARASTPPQYAAARASTPSQSAPTGGKIVKRGSCGDNVSFTLDSNGVLTISGNGPMRDFEWDEKAEVYQTPWLNECPTIQKADIQNGVTTIGDSAFWNCAALRSVTIPDSVTKIGEYAFFGCASLTSVRIPRGVTTMKSGAFIRCASLISVTIPGGVASIESGTFMHCVALTSVTISGGVTKIGEWAFQACASLKSVTIPDSVTEIGEDAFAGCDSLKSVSVPAHTKISYGLFGAKKAFPNHVRVTRRR